MASTRSISFRSLPHQTELFLDYLELREKTLDFYAHPPSFQALELEARRIEKMAFPRREISALLEKQNLSFGSSAATLGLIEDLAKDGSVAVVTGQQVGLFTGPLYTIYKALTAIRVARELRGLGIRAVPLFWMDTEDHDLAEVAQVWALRPDSALHQLDYRMMFAESMGESEHARPVGAISFGPSIRQAVGEYLSVLSGAPWTEAVRSQLEASYRADANFATAFAQLLAKVFGDLGLILFDPLDPGTKPLLSSVFEKALQEAANIHDTLASRNRQLQEAGYHNQVYVSDNSTVLFLHDQGERRALIRLDSGFALKNSDTRFAAADLAEIARRSPERLSPNVLLRPIVQDSLFPTAAYVAGPAEVAYFAQIGALYPLFDRPMPVIWPRSSFTIIGPETAELLERFQLRFEDCLLGKHHVVEKIIASRNNSGVTSTLKGLQEFLEQSLEDVRPGVVAADASLGAALDTAKRKIFHQVEGLQTKFVHLEARHNQTILDRADFLLNNCYPNKSLQERMLSIHNYTARYGPDLPELIYSCIRSESFEHKLLTLV